MSPLRDCLPLAVDVIIHSLTSGDDNIPEE